MRVDHAREAALETLAACRRNGAWVDGALKQTLKRSCLSSRDAAFASRIAYGVMQNRIYLDRCIARCLTQRIEKLEQQNRNLANDLQQQRETTLEQEEEYSKETVIWRETEESLQEQVRTATEQLEKSKLEIVRLKAEIYDILSKNGDI